MKITNEGIESVKGFLSLGKSIGIKKASKDFAILFSEKPCNSAAVFTKNKVKGAPLLVTKEHLKKGIAQAIVVNSGNANVCTGKKGIENAEKITEMVAQELGISKEGVLIASTGIIGKQLPMEKFTSGIKGIKNELSEKSDFAEAILTTDKSKKQICVEGSNFKVAGVAKGSGMISPNMATMLAFIVTDAKMDSDSLHACLMLSAKKSFNMVSVDMDTSTSDMAVLMANGNAGNIKLPEFQECLNRACIELAKMIAKDGEGATKLLIADVINAESERDARQVAKRIIMSPLVKCAVFGHDPNWGRILCAIGNSGGRFDEERIDVYINNEIIAKHGIEIDNFDSYRFSKLIEDSKEVTIKVDLGLGKEKATAYGCDMTYDYVKINAQYST